MKEEVVVVVVAVAAEKGSDAPRWAGHEGEEGRVSPAATGVVERELPCGDDRGGGGVCGHGLSCQGEQDRSEARLARRPLHGVFGLLVRLLFLEAMMTTLVEGDGKGEASIWWELGCAMRFGRQSMRR